MGSPDRHGLDHDCASSMGGTRSDVTRGLWISLGLRWWLTKQAMTGSAATRPGLSCPPFGYAQGRLFAKEAKH
jgi:hypothetical protein